MIAVMQVSNPSLAEVFIDRFRKLMSSLASELAKHIDARTSDCRYDVTAMEFRVLLTTQSSKAKQVMRASLSEVIDIAIESKMPKLKDFEVCYIEALHDLSMTVADLLNVKMKSVSHECDSYFVSHAVFAPKFAGQALCGPLTDVYSEPEWIAALDNATPNLHFKHSAAYYRRRELEQMPIWPSILKCVTTAAWINQSSFH